MKIEQSVGNDGDRTAYYDRISNDSIIALWTRLQALAPPEPRPSCSHHIWPYERLRPLLQESANIISAEQAERRVLVFENPGLPGSSRATPTLNAGVQLILPGEVAVAHRHSISAFRLVLEGKGAFTTVNGERTEMNPGDFVVTPAWSWHAHEHEGEGPMIWLDGLDFGIVSTFNAVFFDRPSGNGGPEPRQQGDAHARFGSGLLPLSYDRKYTQSPLINYPYTRTREALYALSKSGDPDPYGGYIMRYANPVDGGWAMSTMATMIRLLPKGFRSRPYKSTESSIFSVVEGSGTLFIGDKLVPFAPRDTFVVPNWQSYEIEARSDAVLFSYSDRAAQEKLGLFREHLS